MLIDRSLEGSSKESKGLERAWLTNPWEFDQSFSQKSAWLHDSSSCPYRLDLGGMWYSIDDLSQIIGNSLKTLLKWVPRMRMTEWGAWKCVKMHCMMFPTALASLSLSLYNCALWYAWNLYSSNTSSCYFLSKAGRLASIFSSLIVHNGLFSSFTGKWQALP